MTVSARLGAVNEALISVFNICFPYKQNVSVHRSNYRVFNALTLLSIHRANARNATRMGLLLLLTPCQVIIAEADVEPKFLGGQFGAYAQ